MLRAQCKKKGLPNPERVYAMKVLTNYFQSQTTTQVTGVCVCVCLQLIFLRKSDCHGCAVLLCLVCCLFDLAFLPSHLSLKHVQCVHVCCYEIVCVQKVLISTFHVCISSSMLLSIPLQRLRPVPSSRMSTRYSAKCLLMKTSSTCTPSSLTAPTLTYHRSSSGSGKICVPCHCSC